MHRKQTDQWNFMGIFKGYYDALKSMGCVVDIISEEVDFNQYAVLVAPAYELADEALVAKWKAYAEQGGHLILTGRTATKTRTGHYPEAKRAEIISELIGAQVEFFDNLPPSQTAKVLFNRQTYDWNTWAEGLTLGSAKTLATFGDQFYKGANRCHPERIWQRECDLPECNYQRQKTGKRCAERCFHQGVHTNSKTIRRRGYH
jgi:beta-galactosidase